MSRIPTKNDNVKAVVTLSIAGISRVKYGIVSFAIVSPISMCRLPGSLGKRFTLIPYEKKPAVMLDKYANNIVNTNILPALDPILHIAGVTNPTIIRGTIKPMYCENR